MLFQLNPYSAKSSSWGLPSADRVAPGQPGHLCSLICELHCLLKSRWTIILQISGHCHSQLRLCGNTYWSRATLSTYGFLLGTLSLNQFHPKMCIYLTCQKCLLTIWRQRSIFSMCTVWSEASLSTDNSIGTWSQVHKRNKVIWVSHTVE